MGNRLLPKVGVEPLSALSAVRSEVQELFFLLASLAGGGSHVEARHVADPAVLAQPTLPSKGFSSPGKSDGRTGSISREIPAVPVVGVHASTIQVVKETTSESPVVQSIQKIIEAPHVQYVTVEKVVEKIVEKIVEVPAHMDTEKLVKVQKVQTVDAECFADLGVIMGTEKIVHVKKKLSVDVACFVDFGVILDTAKPEHDEKVLAVDAECSADSGVIRAEMELAGLRQYIVLDFRRRLRNTSPSTPAVLYQQSSGALKTIWSAYSGLCHRLSDWHTNVRIAVSSRGREYKKLMRKKKKD